MVGSGMKVKRLPDSRLCLHLRVRTGFTLAVGNFEEKRKEKKKKIIKKSKIKKLKSKNYQNLPKLSIKKLSSVFLPGSWQFFATMPRWRWSWRRRRRNILNVPLRHRQGHHCQSTARH